MRIQYPLTPLKASFCKFLVGVLGWSLTKVAIYLELNVGSVWRAVNGKRHPNVPPLDPRNHNPS